jgi:membrane-associated protease RseP (regulator of RpoE activity)
VGLPFAVTLLVILLAHEMGHFLTAHSHGVDQSPPFFIPAPTLFGTLGAVILMRSQPPNRRVLLKVAVMGPYAGLLLAVPAAAWGLTQSTPIDVNDMPAGSVWFGSSLLFHGLEQVFSPNGSDVVLHPVAVAGWVGMFVTSLNLIPAAQLDGGHIAYALFGRSQEKISLVVVLLLLGTGMFISCLGDPNTPGATGGEVWILWALLLFVIGLRHPPVRDESIPLTPAQKFNGGIALVVFVLTFIPVPVKMLGVPSAPPTDGRPQQLQPRHFDPFEEPPHHGPAEEFRL